MFRALNPIGAEPRDISTVVNKILDGKINSTGTFTLSTSAASTTVYNARSSSDSVIMYVPTSANASAEIGNGTIFISARNDGNYVLTHANNSQNDRTFLYVILG